MRTVLYVILGVVAVFILSVSIGLFNLGWTKFFRPRQENVRRQAWEQTQSYQHGKLQDLAKYYREYQEADDETERSAIREVIRAQFAEFNAEQVDQPVLRNFLTTMRGF